MTLPEFGEILLHRDLTWEAAMPSRMGMYKKPLEHYIAIKINELHPDTVKRIRISHIPEDARGRNWEVIETIPPPPPEMALEIDREVIAPLREMINLID